LGQILLAAQFFSLHRYVIEKSAQSVIHIVLQLYDVLRFVAAAVYKSTYQYNILKFKKENF